jgi:hypothetical protein
MYVFRTLATGFNLIQKFVYATKDHPGEDDNDVGGRWVQNMEARYGSIWLPQIQQGMLVLSFGLSFSGQVCKYWPWCLVSFPVFEICVDFDHQRLWRPIVCYTKRIKFLR